MFSIVKNILIGVLALPLIVVALPIALIIVFHDLGKEVLLLTKRG